MMMSGTRIAAFSIILSMAVAAPAMAVHNPIVATIRPVAPNGARGRVTVFQNGRDVDVTLILGRDRKGTQSVSINRGTCAKYAPHPQWVVVGVAGSTQETRLPNISIRGLLGHAVVVHATKRLSSPAIGCATLRDRG